MNISGEHVKQKGLFDPFLNMFCEAKNNKQNNIYLGFLVNFASHVHGVLHAMILPGKAGQNLVVLSPKMTFWVLKKVICCECMNIYEGYRVVIVNFARSGWLVSDLKPEVVKQKRPASPIFTFCHFASLAACLASISVFSRRILDD